MTAIVGLSGWARSGKDSAALGLIDKGWQRRSFADKLRSFLLALDPLVEVSWQGTPLRLSWLVERYGWERCKDTFPEVRALLQRVGTDAGRDVLGENIWVDATLGDLPDSTHTPVVITDVRFANEARAIQQRGGIVIRISRSGVGPARNALGQIHVSETALDGFNFDHYVGNDGDLWDLQDRVEKLALVGQGV